MQGPALDQGLLRRLHSAAETRPQLLLHFLCCMFCHVELRFQPIWILIPECSIGTVCLPIHENYLILLSPSRVCWDFCSQGKCLFLFPEYGMQLTDEEPEFGRLGWGEEGSRLIRNLVFFLISCVKSIMIMHLHLYD